MNATVAQLTVRTLLGRRRAVLLLLLPLALFGLCLFARVLASLDADVAAELSGGLAAFLLSAFGLGVVMPLLGLIAGTGSIGPEIDDGSIVYLLAKPLGRPSIVVTKLAVALGVVAVFGALPIAAGAVILTGDVGELAAGFLIGSMVAGAAYCALFLLLSVLTRNAVVIGLIYALVWESLVGQTVPGAQALSIQQWSLAVVRAVLGASADRFGVDSAVGTLTGVALLGVVFVGCTWYAGRRLRTIRLTDEA